jgi:hypothetical protein
MQDKSDELISALYEVGDPAHERYASLFGLRKVTLLTVRSTPRYVKEKLRRLFPRIPPASLVKS